MTATYINIYIIIYIRYIYIIYVLIILYIIKTILNIQYQTLYLYKYISLYIVYNDYRFTACQSFKYLFGKKRYQPTLAQKWRIHWSIVSLSADMRSLQTLLGHAISLASKWSSCREKCNGKQPGETEELNPIFDWPGCSAQAQYYPTLQNDYVSLLQCI